ncbi:hypothetical protein D3C84_1011830 [compost metagenome]
MVEHEQYFRRYAVVIGVNQYRSLFELAAMSREDEVGQGLHEWMTWMDQICHLLSLQPYMLFFKADALVLTQHRGATFAYHAVTLAQGGRDVTNLEARRFTSTQLATNAGEGLIEKGANEIWL